MTISNFNHQDNVDIGELVRTITQRFNLPSEDPVVLDRGMNFVIHLRPSPVVARITRVAHLVRPMSALAGAVALARSLGDLVVPPSTQVDPGPHVLDGRYLTFWSYATGERATPAEAGQALRAFHNTAADFRGELRHFDPRQDALAIADLVGGEAGEILRKVATRLSVPTLPEQAIHGDAHLDNVLRPGRWLDPDDMCRGPREWDIASLTHLETFWGELKSETNEALQAYGPYDAAAVASLAPLVVLFTAAWGSVAPLVGEAVGERTRTRLDWLRTHV